ncbi:MAG: hypothetical protein WAX69_06800 [Victivallales bacterium]
MNANVIRSGSIGKRALYPSRNRSVGLFNYALDNGEDNDQY